MNFRRWVARPAKHAIGIAALLLGGAGCAGYRLGSMLPGDIRTVHVPIVVNRTNEPLLESEATRAVLTRLQFDGTLRVGDAETADAILHIELTSFQTDAIGYRGGRDASPDEYRSRIDARFSLVNRTTGAAIVESRVIGESTFEAGGDPIRAKVESASATAEDLARRLVSRLVEAW